MIQIRDDKNVMCVVDLISITLFHVPLGSYNSNRDFHYDRKSERETDFTFLTSAFLIFVYTGQRTRLVDGS